MEILKDFKNDLLKRQEISLSLEADNNPNFSEIKKQVAKQFKKDEGVVDVYNIKGSFGSNEFKIDAYIYDSKEDLENASQKTKKQLEAEKKVSEEKISEEAQAPSASSDVPSDEGKEGKEKEEEVSADESASEEAPVEDKPEEEAKAVEEEKQAEEESKEN